MRHRFRSLIYLLAAAAIVVSTGLSACKGASQPSAVDSGSVTSPGVAPAPHWPIRGVDAGNTATPSPGPDGVIDRSWSWGSLEWSPDGQTLAAAAESQGGTEGQIHLFDRTGRPVGAVPGWEATWIDDRQLMTLQTDVDGVTWSAWRWSSDATTSARVASGAIELLGNGHGSVAIKLMSSNGHERYRIWRNGGLTDVLAGSPAAWSVDGRQLAVLREVPGAVSGGTGSVPPDSLQVIDGADLHVIAAFAADPFDPRTVISFDPAGSLVATSAFVFDLARDIAYPLPNASEFVAWTPDANALFVSLDEHNVAIWDRGSHQLGPPIAPGTQIETSDRRSVTVPAPTADLPSQLVTPGVVSPRGDLRAWYPVANGLGDTPLRLVPAGR